ncbi:hypothetical protein [Streptomyces diastatochromogenes]|uniref:Uncharacterized protein n=1 Tax=Streptomyces diastatochromogenes TaxID=42236 RepID=A0A233SSI6_STRDA|nr:hypothetical protein [Streptomyces diastatochromogenes]MCZ0987517.1 hypothetical protein [Streptomyces diastatochromogenes]OXY98607.1 hypothetical protein BEK98_07120 [Streptomyces diastatochromogenes]
MRLKLREFRFRTGPHEHRVVQPWQPLRHTSLRDPAPYGVLTGDHDGLNRLAGLFSFAAYSRHTVVHVPLRDTVTAHHGGCGDLVDLVLVHHTYGLRPSQWPELRRRLGGGTPLTVRTDEARTARDAAAWERRRDDSGFRDELRHTTHARTFFLIGSRDVFADTAMSCASAAGWGPRQKRIVKGGSALMGCVRGLQSEADPWRSPEVMICFQAYPPYAHFRRPGESASRPRRPAAVL